MTGVVLLELYPPLDVGRLKVAVGDTDIVQFYEHFAPAEYALLAQLLTLHPKVVMRVYGTDAELGDMKFLQHFPRLRCFSVALRQVTSVEPINVLPDDLELLDVGETAKPLDLRPLKFKNLQYLRVDGHTRGLPELIEANEHLRKLSLWHLKASEIMASAKVPQLEQLELVQGSAKDLSWLARLKNLRYLALSRVRDVDDEALAVINELPNLEWLWLIALPGVTAVPDVSANRRLRRVDLDSMAKMRAEDALTGLRRASNLEEVSITSSHLPVAALRPLTEIATLTAAMVGLGSPKKNQEVRQFLDLPPARSATAFATTFEL
jgi:hypothetical protein